MSVTAPKYPWLGLIVLLVVCFAAAGNASDAFEAGFQSFWFQLHGLPARTTRSMVAAESRPNCICLRRNIG